MWCFQLRRHEYQKQTGLSCNRAGRKGWIVRVPHLHFSSVVSWGPNPFAAPSVTRLRSGLGPLLSFIRTLITDVQPTQIIQDDLISGSLN